ncbi:PLP-dependent aminotransferase family protein [Dyadobacter sp. CY107]|uniref:MocR-like pyridoxine biosynthesis transcription factor PdxR n=1 Tax=Dyadobacter fanqingshengii TaxID=2906443 RepID=UPI001F3DCED6|nr:PLP-dependent aminotransferase family protein [Dyadobacter fanqingshengii]MCF2502037.1 PLP-dependent aminotransferase family protein [Dyadobacter fanqingshengii]
MNHILSALLSLDRSSRIPVFIQIANQIASHIRNGTLSPGSKLPSSRDLAVILGVHRTTIVLAYDELLNQEWVESRKGKGTYVLGKLPVPLVKTPQEVKGKNKNYLTQAGFSFTTRDTLNVPIVKSTTRLHLDDGLPDPRLAPLEDLSRAIRTQLLTGDPYLRLGYGDTKGSLWLRQELSTYLNETRGMSITPENILIVRGLIMGLHLVSASMLAPGNLAAVAAPGWSVARMNFLNAGAKIVEVPVDEYGMDVDALENLCRTTPVRLVYLCPHHSYPTTVSLRSDRRMQLLQLSEKYGFIVFEDDYDYDYHYLSKPLLPLFSADRSGTVLYCGSFSKTISPTFRIGYLVGPVDAIDYMAQLRRIIDRQGDQVLENAVAELLHGGIIQRHLRKALRAYRQRRDYLCSLMASELATKVAFRVPDGGMAVWTSFDKTVDLQKISKQALTKGLYFADGSGYGFTEVNNQVRLGFASSTLPELEESIDIIQQLI